MRFSKATLAARLSDRVTRLQLEWNFDPRNGYAQVEGRGEEINRAYGEWNALRDLMEEFDLPG